MTGESGWQGGVGTAMKQISRRTFLAGCGAAAAGAVGVAAYASLVEPFWADIHEESVRVSGFPAALAGLRIAHLTDLHLDFKMPMSYPLEIARRVREEIRPDVVAFTGDLTTHNAAFIDRGAEWLASFGVPTVVCLGNHDYDPDTSARVGNERVLASLLADALRGTKVHLLRNRSVELRLPAEGDGKEAGGSERSLWVAGVEDWYTGDADAGAAVDGVPENVGRLMLCHNPDGTPFVDEATREGLILSGHTHGGQIRVPGVGAVLLPLMDREKANGKFLLGKRSTLYVSRGVGFLLRARVFCRPEVVVHRVV